MNVNLNILCLSVFLAGEHIGVWQRSLFTLSDASSGLDSVIVALPHSTIVIWVPLPSVFLSLIRTPLRSPPNILLVFQLSVSSSGAFQLCAVTAEHDGKTCLSTPDIVQIQKNNCLKSFHLYIWKTYKKKTIFLLPWSIFACQIQEWTWFVSKQWNMTRVLTVIITISHCVFIWVLLRSRFSAKPWRPWMLKRWGRAAFVEILVFEASLSRENAVLSQTASLRKKRRWFRFRFVFIWSFCRMF